jgi:hypothetical protein
VVLDAKARILLGQPRQRVGKFLLLPLVLGFQREAEHRGRKRQRRERDAIFVVRIVQHRIEVDVLDLRHRGDVAGNRRFDLHMRLALQAKQMADLERLAAVVDQQLAVAADRALPYAEHAELADERIVDDLEHVGDHVARRIGDRFQRRAVAAHERRRIAFGRIRQQPRGVPAIR